MGRFGSKSDDVALHDRDAAALVEIAHGDADAAPSTLLLAMTAPSNENSE